MAQTRITGGEWRGRLIDTPRGMKVRPTRSLVRQSLFDILGARVLDSTVVDLYAGAGTVGFESLSRGARTATFVDHERGSMLVLAATATRLGCRDRCRWVCADSIRWVRRSAGALAETDICFIDAPYRDPDLDHVLQAVALAPPALVVCEHHHRRLLPERVGDLALVREVRHGLTTLSFLQRNTIDGGDGNR